MKKEKFFEMGEPSKYGHDAVHHSDAILGLPLDKQTPVKLRETSPYGYGCWESHPRNIVKPKDTENNNPIITALIGSLMKKKD